MSAMCNVCEGELPYDLDCTWCQLVELRRAADALAKAVEDLRCKMLRDADRHHARQQDKYIEQLEGTIEALRRALERAEKP